jgi:glycosyltransferase involved in cell wall biosynthesis
LKGLAIIPCFNEAAALPGLLTEFERVGAPCDTLVVDDGSADNTYDVAAARTRALRLPFNLGIGGAVQAGIRYAYERGYDYCIQVDGDGQHPPEEIARLLETQSQTRASLVIGSRFLSEVSFRTTWTRRLGIAMLRLALRAFHGIEVQDLTSGFRLMDRAAMRVFVRDYPQDFPEPLSLAIAASAGIKIAETPVRMRAREHGQSSIQGFKTVAYMARVIGYLFILRVGKSWS